MPTKSMEAVRANVIERIVRLANALHSLESAKTNITEAEAEIITVWAGWPLTYGEKTQPCNALLTFVNMTVSNIECDLHDAARQAGFLMACDVIAPVARDSSKPVVWLTSNRYMPPLRDLSEAESIWQACGDLHTVDVWPTFVESLEAQLDKENVLMDTPEHDNMLYVVDLARWEFIENGDSDLMHGDGDENSAWQVRNA